MKRTSNFLATTISSAPKRASARIGALICGSSIAMLAGCAAPVVDRAESTEVDVAGGATSEEWSRASDATAAHGVAFYQVERAGGDGRVILGDKHHNRMGEMVSSALRPGVQRLGLKLDGEEYRFDVDTTQDPPALSLTSGGETATVLQDPSGSGVTGDAGALALYNRIEPQWELARGLFVEASLDTELRDDVNRRLVDRFEAPEGKGGFEWKGSQAADLYCPNQCVQNQCSWFWPQTWYYVLVGNQCYSYGHTCGC